MELMRYLLLLSLCSFFCLPGNSQTKLTHSSSESMTGGSINCNIGSGAYHSDNFYLRKFSVSDFGITETAQVLYMEIGIRGATSLSGSQTVHATLYTLSGDFITSNLTFLNTRSISLNDTSTAKIRIPLTASVEPGDTLVAEFFTPSGSTTDSNYIGIGFNNSGETDDSYLKAPLCGIAEPSGLDTTGSGFPNSHMVLNVWVNQIPKLVENTYNGFLNTTFEFTEPHIRLCFDDADGDKPELLEILDLPVNGTLMLGSSPVSVSDSIAKADFGILDYVPNTGFIGLDSFRIRARDKHHWSTNEVNLIVRINGASSIENTEANNSQADKIFLSPNPTKTTTAIQGLDEFINGQLQILSLDGKLIRELNISQPNITLDLNDLNAGIYLLRGIKLEERFTKALEIIK